jgi:YYY domain-containing protein
MDDLNQAVATPEIPAPPTPRTGARDRIRKLLALWPDFVLVALIACGMYFRFAGNNWSEGTNLDPDELGFNNVVSGVHLPASLDGYFNTRISPLSPYLKYDKAGNETGQGPDPGWVWGQWPIIVVRAAAEGLTAAEQTVVPPLNAALAGGCADPQAADCPRIKAVDYTDYGQIRLLGRFLSALADAVSVLVILAIGLRLYGRRVALLGAALSALAVTQIQYAHFMTIDNIGVMSGLLAMYGAVRAAQKGGYRWYAWFGVFYGMALASRSNLAPLGAAILVAVLVGQRERLRNAALGFKDRLGVPAAMFAFAVAATVLSFRIAQPMAFRTPTGDTGFFTLSLNPEWLDRMKYAAAVSSGSAYIAGYPPAEHWAGHAPFLTPLLSIVLWGLGLPLGIAAFAGLIWAGYRAYRGIDWETHTVPVAFTAVMFLFLASRWVAEMRYFLVIYPFLCLFAAWALAELWKKAAQGRGQWKRALAGFCAGAVVLGTLAWAWQFSAIYRTENTRLAASRWIYGNFTANFRLGMDLPGGGEYQQGVNYPYEAVAADPEELSFRANRSGTVRDVTVGHIIDQLGAPGSVLRVELYAEPRGEQPLAAVDIAVPAPGEDPRGPSVTAALGPVDLAEGRAYHLIVSAVRGGPLAVKGAWFVFEGWDEPLPFNLDGYDADMMFDRRNAVNMNIEWPDSEDKRRMLIDNLSQADYVIVQSQRRLWSVCRMPAVYPLTLEYYRALFDGSLGFELAAEFQHPIAIGPLEVSDLAGTLSWGSEPRLPVFNLNPLAAEESFSVYDHAPVWIFRKRADFSAANAAAILGAVDISHVAKQDAGQSFAVLNNLMLPPDRLAQQQAGGTWSQMFSYDWVWNRYPGLAAWMWFVWAAVTGWAAFPIVSFVFRGLPDEGYSVSRVAGWLLVAWAVWMLSSNQVPFVWTTIFAVWLAFVALGAFLAWRDRARLRESFQKLKRTWLTMELVFAAFFLFDLLLRVGYGDLWHLWTGGEKPMDFSYLNAVIRSTSFPPYDPWFSGGYLNYYYWGFVLVAIPIKLLGTVPSIGYNLALPLLFGTLGVTTYGVAWNLVESLRRKGALRVSPIAAGIGAAVMLAVLGNLGEVRYIWEGLISASSLSLPQGLLFGAGDLLHAAAGAFRILTGQAIFPGGYDGWYWAASRAIHFPPGPNGEYVTDWSITEFPFFTFLYADLHAHLIAMPLILLSLAGTLAMILAPERLSRWQTALPLIAFTALAVGSLWPTNSWNYPVSLVIAAVGLAFAAWRWFNAGGRWRDWRSWVWMIVLLGLLAGLSVLLFQPYWKWNGATGTSFTVWKGVKTPIESYLVIHGLFVFILLTYLAAQTVDWLRKTPAPDRGFFPRWGPVFLISGTLFLLGVVGFALAGYQVLVLAVPVIVWAIVLGLRKDVEDEHRLILGLTAISFAITCFVEFIVLANDMDRQNTVFKFYIQAWIFFAIAAGAALGWLASRVPGWRLWPRRIWTAALGLLVLGAFSYTIFGSYYRITDRMSPDSPHSLDGIAFMPYVTYSFIDDYSNGTYDLKETYDAIRWLQENVSGSPVIVQSPWPHYRGGLPYTFFTGLPNVLGWNYHQRQQRGAVADAWVWERDTAIQAFYETEDYDAARAFLRTYDVKYIIVSQLERAYYPGPGLDKFDAMVQSGELRVVFAENKTVIYEVLT